MAAMNIETDRKLIAQLGGPSAVASMLGFKKHGAQRVNNWIHRGIPPSIRVAYPNLFFLDVMEKSGTNSATALANSAQTATENVAQGVANV